MSFCVHFALEIEEPDTIDREWTREFAASYATPAGGVFTPVIELMY